MNKPIGKKVVLTSHAIDRYHERIKPQLFREAARLELQRLLYWGELKTECPWATTETYTAADTDAYLLLGDGICLPLLDRGTEYIATTVLTRNSKSPMARARKRQKRRAKATKRRADKRRRMNGRPDRPEWD